MEIREMLTMEDMEQVIGGNHETDIGKAYKVRTRNGGSLNFRRSMKTHCKNRICNIPNNAHITCYTFYPNGWAEIEYNSEIGYVKSEFIKPC